MIEFKILAPRILFENFGKPGIGKINRNFADGVAERGHALWHSWKLKFENWREFPLAGIKNPDRVAEGRVPGVGSGYPPGLNSPFHQARTKQPLRQMLKVARL